MRNSYLCLVFLAPLLLAGCMVRSLNPIYTDEDLVQVPEVEGTWKGDDETTFSFVREGDGYLFSVKEKESSVTASAHFVRLGSEIYMDLTIPEETFDAMEKLNSGLPMTVGLYTTPVHVFYQIERTDGLFRMRTMNHGWVKERRDKGRLWIGHIAQDDSTLLIADTARVQRFLRKWAHCDEAWSDWEEIPLNPAQISMNP
ncbi:MAG: hypothetical protein SGI88_01035 [Candidatus Hydrogenedentes bacterium]|nr:hypothetical protein [Candidatus Hydrogenedentota bacterium]